MKFSTSTFYALLAVGALNLSAVSVLAQTTQPANNNTNNTITPVTNVPNHPPANQQILQQQTNVPQQQGKIVNGKFTPARMQDNSVDPMDPGSIKVTVPEGEFATMEPAEGQARIQMAILLDTSSSMDGLIDQARSQLWRIVNEFAKSKKNGKTPMLEIALFEYGKSTQPDSEGFIRMITPLTVDLDIVSEELFKLNTNGGQEYCGHVIAASTNMLKWSDSKDDLRVIFIAGNEPFTQGSVLYTDAIKLASEKKITISTIHCGNERAGVDGKWRDGAVLGGGQFLNINQDKAIIHIESPFDKELAELGHKINNTYIAYGASGKDNKLRQSTNDAALAKPAEMAKRTQAKGSAMYDNSHWDLVDAIDKGTKLEDIKEEDLPEEMKKMTLEERKAYVTKKTEERNAIRARIAELSKKRDAYVAEKRKEMTEADGEASLDDAIVESIQTEGAEAGFEFGN